MATQENGFIDLFCDETPYSITDVTNTVVLNTQVAVEFRQPAGCNCAGGSSSLPFINPIGTSVAMRTPQNNNNINLLNKIPKFFINF